MAQSESRCQLIKSCGVTLRELCINKCMQTSRSEALVLRRVGQNSFTAMREANGVIQKTITASSGC